MKPSLINPRVRLMSMILSVASFLPMANADIIIINNASFEDPVLTDGTSSGISTPGWAGVGARTFLNPSTTHFPGGNAFEGSNVATLNAGGNGSILFQNLSNTLQFGTYTFEFEVGDRLDQSLHNVGFSFLINGTSIVPLTSSSTPTVPDGEFRTWSFTYNVLNPVVFSGFIGDPTRIRFLAHGSSGFSTIDNVRGSFVASVPEPGGLTLFSAAILFPGLFLRRRNRITTKTCEGNLRHEKSGDRSRFP